MQEKQRKQRNKAANKMAKIAMKNYLTIYQKQHVKSKQKMK
jgi:hypothetical protein